MGRGAVTCAVILLSTTIAAAGPPPASAAPSHEPPPAGETAGEHRRNVATFVTIAGATLVVAGIGLGVYANHEYEAVADGRILPPREYVAAERARLYGNVGTVTGGVGLAAVATGLVLWLTAPSDRETTIAPTVTPGGGGVAVAGRF